MSWVVLCHSWGEFSRVPMKDVGPNLLKVQLFHLSMLCNVCTIKKSYTILKQTASNDMEIQVILNGFPSVDSFFLISGVLMAYLTLKELDKTCGRVSIPLFYVHRYLRYVIKLYCSKQISK